VAEIDKRVLPELGVFLASAAEIDPTLPVAELRATADAGVVAAAAAIRAPVVPLVVSDHAVPVAGGEVAVRVYRPETASAAGAEAHLHVHGGGWWMGSLETADASCRDLASESGWVVVSVGYRLAPEHPFPTPLDDVLAAIEWVATNGTELGIDVSAMTVGGESAGANLAAAACLALRDRSEVRFVAQWLDVPALDLTLETGQESMREFAAGYGLDRAGIELCVGQYVDPDLRRDPMVSPMLGDLSGLPPAVISVAECDPLRDQGTEYAGRLSSAGVPAEVTCWPGHIHSTMWLTSLIPSARDCRRWAIDSLDRHRREAKVSA
jgi:acetyl esterase